MHFFGILFWIALAWLAFRALRRWGYCSSMGPRSHDRLGGWYDSSEFHLSRKPVPAPEQSSGTEAQQDYIDSLETRVSELEERLDFTERLLANRREYGTSGQEASSPS